MLYSYNPHFIGYYKFGLKKDAKCNKSWIKNSVFRP